MRVRRLDKNHDWTFGQSHSNYATKSEAIAQCVKTAVLSFAKDWFLDLDHGIPWFDYLEKNPNLRMMEADIKLAVLNVEGVREITLFDIELSRETREAVVSVRYLDSYGRNMGVITNVGNNS